MVDSAESGGWGKPIVSKVKPNLNPKAPGFEAKKSVVPEDVSNEPGLAIVLRTKEGIFLSEHNVKQPTKDESNKVTKADSLPLVYSPDGDYLLYTVFDDIHLLNLTTKKLEILEKAYPLATGFSSTGTFFFYAGKAEKDKFSLKVHSTETLEQLQSIDCGKFKRDQWPYLQFNSDDSLCVYQVTQNSLQIRKPLDKFSEVAELKLGHSCDVYKFSEAKDSPILATMSIERFVGFNKTEAKLEIYSLPEVSKPVFSKVIPKAQEVKFLVPSAGAGLLIWTQTIHDDTEKSYYGEHQLFFYDATSNKMKTVPTYDGPIHDVAWAPDGNNFTVISGYMPGGSVLFDNQCVPKFEFGKHHRNTIRYSPHSRFLCLGGFGNLAGDIEVWDLTTLTKIGQFKSNAAVYCGWSPDGRKIMTAVLNPRLRVDNNIKTFKYNGLLINSVDYSHSELYEVAWRPGKYEDRPASPNALKISQQLQEAEDKKPKKIFQPKGSGMLSEMLKKDKGQNSAGRHLNPDETFGNPRIEAEKEKEKEIAADEDKKKKKRVRKKKEKGNAEGADEESKND
jgi:translation initiation factor 2A